MINFSQLNVKLTLTIGSVVLVVVLIASELVNYYAREQIKSDQTMLLEQTVSNMMSRLSQDMATRANEIIFLSQREMLIDPNVPSIKKQHILESIRRSYQHYAWIGITDPEGNVMVGTDGLLVGKNVSQRSWFMGGSKSLFFGDAHDAFLLAKLLPKPKWDDLPLRLVDVSAPMLDENGKLIGVICGHLSLDWAFEARNKLLDQLNHQVDLIVLNKEGKVLMGTPSLPSLEADLSDLDTFQASLNGKLVSKIETWNDHQTYLTSAIRDSGYGYYESMGWVVIARKSTDTAFYTANKMTWLISLLALISSVLLIIVINRILTRQLKPLKEISKAAEHIANHDLSVPLPTLTDTKSELAQLIQHLTKLVACLQENNAELLLASRVFADSTQGIMITDADKKIIRVNKALTKITGYEPEEIIGQKPDILKSGKQPAAFYQQMWQAINYTGSWQGEIWNQNKDGHIYPEWLSVLVLKNEKEQVTNYIGIFDDISEKKSYQQQLVHLANYDLLTNLPNRHLMQQHAQLMLDKAKEIGNKISFIFIDLDKFKHINDSLGHVVGDRVLLEISARFKHEIESDMLLSRWGGDEFVLVIPAADQRLIAHVLQKLFFALQAPFVINDVHYHLSMSAGVAVYPDDALTVEQLLRCADTAMYRAKNEGSNLYRFYEGTMQEEVTRFMRIDNAMRATLANHGKGLSMVYQPKYHTNGKTLLGAEALIRWQSDELGTVNPGEFIPIIEDSGQIITLGNWIVEQVAKDYQQLMQLGCQQVQISINCSAKQLMEPSMADHLHHILMSYEVPPRMITFEVTESAVLSDEVVALKTIQALKKYGYAISIDDFGTGYACLSYMQKIAPTEVKIDQRFISSINDNSDSHSIVVFTHGLAQSMGIHMVAEGVETQQQLQTLTNIGSDIHIQGYLLSKPLSFDKFKTFLNCQISNS